MMKALKAIKSVDTNTSFFMVEGVAYGCKDTKELNVETKNIGKKFINLLINEKSCLFLQQNYNAIN